MRIQQAESKYRSIDMLERINYCDMAAWSK